MFVDTATVTVTFPAVSIASNRKRNSTSNRRKQQLKQQISKVNVRQILGNNNRKRYYCRVRNMANRNYIKPSTGSGNPLQGTAPEFREKPRVV
jgi:hypothetical protein